MKTEYKGFAVINEFCSNPRTLISVMVSGGMFELIHPYDRVPHVALFASEEAAKTMARDGDKVVPISIVIDLQGL